MVVCKFFLQGRCKFGQNCRYEHQIDDNTQSHSVSIMRQSQQSHDDDSDDSDINSSIITLQTDMLTAERGKQWMLSSYAPFKNKPAFPGFEDKSFEEVRHGHYEASKSGTVEQHVQQFQAETKNAALKCKALQNPSPEAVHILTQIYNSPENTGNFASSSQSFPERNSSNTLLHSSSNFNSSKSIFGQNNQTVFGRPSVFASNKSNIFSNTGNSTQSSFFSSPAQNSPNIFGGGQKSIFAGSQQPYSNSIFGQQKNTLFNQPQNSVFNSSFKQSSINPFKTQTNNSPFSGQVSNSPFNSTRTNAPPVFAVQNHSSNSPLAGNFITTQPSSVFNTVSQASPYKENNSYVSNNPSFNVQQSQPPGSVFANSNITDFNNPRQQDSVFSATQLAPVSLLGGSPPEEKALGNSIFGARNTSTLSIVNIDESVYSKIENLSESDIKAYESDHFEFGKIPEKPPTIQMCF